MKKLLILGGNALSCDIVTTAKSLGIYTIVTDWNNPSKSPAKKIADESWNVSLMDYDELKKRIIDNGINGITTNYTDSYLIPYAKLCKISGLPSLTGEKQIYTISTKSLSKELCKQHGIPVSKGVVVSDEPSLNKLIDSFDFSYPVLVKPVDQSGQRGIYVCNNEDELRDLYLKSKSFSSAGEVLIEEYLSGDYVVMFFTIQDGTVTLSTMADKPVSPIIDPNLVRLPLAYILPSRYINLCKSTILPKVQDFVNTLQIRQGVIGIEAIVHDNQIHVFEMQFRLGGMRHHEFVLQENGMDIMEMLIRFAISGKFDGYNALELDNPDFKHKYVLLNILINPGKIKSIKGIEKIRDLPVVTKITQMHKEGDEVALPSTVDQILCKVSLKLDKEVNLNQLVDHIYGLLDVRDENGESMLVNYLS